MTIYKWIHIPDRTFQEVYLMGGVGKNMGSTDYVIGYQCDNGMYIAKHRRHGSVSAYDWHVSGKSFATLEEAKKYCSGF